MFEAFGPICANHVFPQIRTPFLVIRVQPSLLLLTTWQCLVQFATTQLSTYFLLRNNTY